MSDWTDIKISPDMRLVTEAAARQLSEDIKDLREMLQAAQKENEEQAKLLAMSADREEKLRAALQRITECDMRWSKKVAREALQ
jgi:hypothetical protein